MLQRLKNQKIAAIWAIAGIVPLALPGFPEVHFAGLHRFYLKEYGWGMVYLFFGLFTPIPWIAGVIEGVWYLVQDEAQFNQNFNQGVSADCIAIDGGAIDVSGLGKAVVPTLIVRSVSPAVKTAEAIRELDRLRQEGLLSEYEFEQKRRQLIDRLR
jgi:TM2 domain-containing membrane protein YozV